MRSSCRRSKPSTPSIASQLSQKRRSRRNWTNSPFLKVKTNSSKRRKPPIRKKKRKSSRRSRHSTICRAAVVAKGERERVAVIMALSNKRSKLASFDIKKHEKSATKTLIKSDLSLLSGKLIQKTLYLWFVLDNFKKRKRENTMACSHSTNQECKPSLPSGCCCSMYDDKYYNVICGNIYCHFS